MGGHIPLEAPNPALMGADTTRGGLKHDPLNYRAQDRDPGCPILRVMLIYTVSIQNIYSLLYLREYLGLDVLSTHVSHKPPQIPRF